MPRVAKAAKGGAASGAGKGAGAAAKKKNGYVKSEKIPLGEILTDLSGQGWKIGPSIGSGGFGDIYCACKAGSSGKKDYDCVIKIEPHGNGPLFVEMHFYMRNARQEDIKSFCAKHKLKMLGMPHIIGSGSHTINGEKHRFLVIPRYGKDIWSFFLSNGKRLPQHTIYRIAIQMLDVYEYIHSNTYVHADLKGANILLDYTGKHSDQVYLVDFGLACHYTTSDYKPDPRKMHNGTIEYTSRDAHNGVPTRRGDFEILGYNLIHWSGVELPWETQKLLANPQKVQKAKEEFMKDVGGSLSKLFDKNPPSPVKQFMDYVQSMDYKQTPDYEKCRKIFQAGLKSLNKTNSGPLEVTLGKSPPKQQKRPIVEEESENESESEPETSRKPSPVKLRSSATPSKRTRPADAKSPISPSRRRFKANVSPQRMASPAKSITSRLRQHITPTLNISTRSGTSSPADRKPGKTIVNDNVTPNPRSNKTYEFNFELDVSLDANVVVNVKRKKKAPSSKASEPVTSTRGESKENVKRNQKEDSDSEVPPSPVDSPLPRVSVRRLQTSAESPARSPRVTYRRVK
ncbi:unnamed protein product [Hermetia illucens]|uniref:non-specific serine/threonine protein kinase n=1 Tax=Hermetia illucens TaxID=343691 RepID=A0A7R8V0E6_HERIL|nr:nucleosomal histone kinase 1-like [Hermetia illucens]CAD7090428.1 unnamed protein product [Hermetia illucens]